MSFNKQNQMMIATFCSKPCKSEIRNFYRSV